MNCCLPTPGISVPLIIGHRGAMAKYPENTRLSFDSALLSGVHGIELDLQLTRDNIPVVFHDRTLKKMGYPFRRVNGFYLSELKKFHYTGASSIKNNQKIMTFYEVLSLYAKKTNLFIEIKIRGGFNKAYNRHICLVKKTIELIKKNKAEHRVTLLCFYPEILEVCRLTDPSLKQIVNIKNKAGWKKAKSYTHAIDAYCLRMDFLKPSLVEEVHRQNKPVFTYTVNTPSDLEYAAHCGADGLFTNDPKWLSTYFTQKKPAHES